MKLRPFWRYYGGKSSSALRYPPPRYPTIVEPFAGSAGYSLAYPERDVILVEKNDVLAALWSYLVTADPKQILAVPDVDSYAEIPEWAPDGLRYLVGFCMGEGDSHIRKTATTTRRARPSRGWRDTMRNRAASQVESIRHWKVIRGDYRSAPDVEATYFVDPPYDNKAGKAYPTKFADYPALAEWCRARKGQVIACENYGATWLPFRPFGLTKSHGGRTSREVIWANEEMRGI